jgi:hypothetical protein
MKFKVGDRVKYRNSRGVWRYTEIDQIKEGMAWGRWRNTKEPPPEEEWRYLTCVTLKIIQHVENGLQRAVRKAQES